MGRQKGQGGGGMKRKNKLRDCPEKDNYKEYGVADPFAESGQVKRLKIRDTEEKADHRNNYSDASSDEETENTDAVAKLLATFKTNSNTAIDSEDDSDDVEEEEESEDDEVDGEIDEDGSEVEFSDENVDGVTDEEGSEVEDDENSQSGKDEESQAVDNEDEDVMEDIDDPYKKHFELNIDADMAEVVQNSENWSSNFEEWPVLKRVKMDIPKVEKKQPKLLLLATEESEREPPNIGSVPKPPPRKQYDLDKCHLVNVLKKNIPIVNGTKTSCQSGFTDIQKELFDIMSNYSDLYYPEANYEKYEEIQTVYAIHALNHTLKHRKRVLKNNEKVKKNLKKKKKKGERDNDQCYRDQGYTRPKVLIILPFRHSAYRLIEVMSSLLQDRGFVMLKKSRFTMEYGPGEEENKNIGKSEDFKELFKGNRSEDFKIGLKMTKKTIKLYSNFFESDMIVASPLGLRTMMGSFKLGSSDTDFLSSIEVLIIDQADALMMQNWEHMLVLMEVLNKPPHDIHKLDTSLNRIRMWALDGHASIYRQTILFSAAHIDHNRALISKCRNFTGRVQVLNPVTDGSIQEVVAPAELILIRIQGLRDPDLRFNYFIKEILPQYQANRRIGVMVYIPDYCDYVRLVKYLKEDGGVSFASINEYIAGNLPKLAKIRSLFFDAKKQFLLYTERFHFYRRYRIKGVRHIIFYGLPTYPHFFSEICNHMVSGNQNWRTKKKHIGSSTVSVLYQQSDLTKLVGVVGSQRAGEILKAQKNIHLCLIGS